MAGASTSSPVEPAAQAEAPAVPAAAPAAGPMPLSVAARRLSRYLRPQARATALAFVSLLLAASLEPLVPAYFKLLLDRGFSNDLGVPTWVLPLAVVAIFVVRGSLGFVGAYLFAWAGSQAVLALRRDLIGALMRSQATLYTSLNPGVAASRVIHDPQNATGSLIGAGTTLLRDGTTFIALLAYLFWLDWRLTLISLVSAPVLVLLVRSVHRRVVRLSGESYESQMRLVGIVDDIVRGWRVVRSFGAQPREQRRFDDEAHALRRATLKATTAGALMTPLTQTVASIAVAVIVALVIVDVRAGQATVGEFVAFLTALLMTISPLRRLTDVTQPIVGGLITARGCFDLIDTPPEPDSGTRTIDVARGDIAIERLEVWHAGAEQPALRSASLHLAPGEIVALVGRSGAGKSTLVSALLGFVVPRSGRVLLDGIDIATLTKASLRRQFAVVSQEAVLFDASVDDNVAYADLQSAKDPARIEECLRAAHLWDVVQALPERGATRIGTDGSTLSGGQRQRLTIARALYKRSPVWIFDEATSALDAESERAVHDALDTLRGHASVLVIAHRLSSVRRADRICVLVDGRIVEAGRHDALLESGGAYAAMVNAQMSD
jgi:ATP-binding cassette, subfamily B, bacterial MsbA